MFFLCVGALSLVPVRSAHRFRRSAIRIAGIVVGYEVQREAEAGTRYDPVVTYRDGGGVERTAVVRGIRRRTFTPGQSVTVLHLPAIPGRVAIVGLDGFREQTIGAIGFIVFGCLSCLVGFMIWFCRIPVSGPTGPGM
jgi:hypothetical protein